jgi:hypothetical protein
VLTARNEGCGVKERLPDGAVSEERLEGVNAFVAHVRRSASEADSPMDSLYQFGKSNSVTKTEQIARQKALFRASAAPVVFNQYAAAR